MIKILTVEPLQRMDNQKRDSMNQQSLSPFSPPNMHHLHNLNAQYCIQHMEDYNRKMKKSISSKQGSCLSFLAASVGKDETALELMRISLKKESDRKERLEKMLTKYEAIRTAERTHIKTVKASIIELKDIATVPKIHFLIDPNIYVDNNLSIETRQFLCIMLNTFYKRYEENADFQKRAYKLSEGIRQLIRSISCNEENLFKVQKLYINHQVQLEGELFSERNKLKEEVQRGKELEAEERRVRTIWYQHKMRYDEQKREIEELKVYADELEDKIMGLSEKITQGEQIRQGNQQKLSGEMAYQLKFEQQVNLLKQSITDEFQRQKKLKKLITQKKMKIDKLQGRLNCDNNKHEVRMKLLELSQPRPSMRHFGVAQILDLEKSLTYKTSHTQSTA